MTADPVVLRPDDTIAVAIHKMAVATGIVSARDLFKHILEAIG
jgi:hypothetical protein